MFRKASLFVAILSLFTLLDSRLTQAQEITVDGNTATIVTKNGDRITIDGNTLSKDGKNLFHSFREFGLTNQQIATFLTNPNIQNILTRVTGGNPSYINGLIKVVGGNSNLFLMNPAGIVFGQGASINVPADFTATTATGIGFNNGILNAIGSNDYSNLKGNPTNFVFNTNQPGSIINAGDLKVAQGSNINLIGGNVINTGTIETPQGKINIQAVEGTSRIKITPEGSLLSLEIDIPTDEEGNLVGIAPKDLPTLLTGANDAGISTPNVTVNNNQVQVANTTIPEGTGSSIVSGKVSTTSETLGGEITVLGNKVGVINGEIEANGATGGGKVLIGGDYQGKGTISNSSVTVVNSGSQITANATDNGNGGNVIVWSDGNTSFTGKIEAKGGINGGDGGFVEVSGKENLIFNGTVNTTAINGNTGTLLLDPENVTIVNGAGAIDDSQISDGQILAGDGVGVNYTISENALESLDGTTNVVIEANNNIIIDDLADDNLTFQSNVTAEDNKTSITFEAGNDFVMDASDVIIAFGRDLNIVAGNDISVGAINTTSSSGNGSAGNIILDAGNSIFVLGSSSTGGETYSLASFIPVDSGSSDAEAGLISLIARNGNITITQANANIIGGVGSNALGATDDIMILAPNGTTNLPSSILIDNADFGSDVITSEEIFIQAQQINGGNISFLTNADQIFIGGNPNFNLNANVNTNGAVLDITSFFTTIEYGGNPPETFTVSTPTNVNFGSSNVTITGNLSVNATQNITDSGAITVTGNTTLTTPNNITLDFATNDFNTVTIPQGNNVILVDENAINLGTTSLNSLNVTAQGEITDSGAITVTGITTLNTPNNIILDSIGNDFGDVRIVNAQNTTLRDIDDIVIFSSSIENNLVINSGAEVTIDDRVTGNTTQIGNNLIINAGGDITESFQANLIVGGTTTLDAGNDIILDNPGNDFNLISANGENVTLTDINTLTLTNSLIPNNLTLTLGSGIDFATLTVGNDLTVNSQGNITDSGDITVGGVTSLNPNNGDVILDNIGNDFNTVSIFNADNVTLTDVNDVTLNPLTISGNLILNVSGITQLNQVTANSLTTDNLGTTLLNGNVTTIADQIYNDDVILNTTTTLTTNNLTAKSIEVDTDSPNLISLTIDANDSVSITGKINENQPLAISTARNNQPSGDIIINAENNIDITGAINTTASDVESFVPNAGDVSITSQNGDVSVFAIGTFGINTSGKVSVSGDNLNLGPIISFIEIDSLPNSTGGIIDLQGNNIIVTGEIRGESLTTTGNLTLNNNPNIPSDTPFFGNSNITTTGNQIYNDDVILNTSTTLTTNNLTAKSIEVDANSSNPISLTIDANDSVSITGKINENQPLAISTARNNQPSGDITINAENNIDITGAINTNASDVENFVPNAGDVSITSRNGDVSALAIASIGTETSGNVTISGNNINLGTILTFLTPNNVTTGDIDIQGNNTRVSGTIQGLSLTTSGTFTLAENPSILALPNANLASLGKASVNTINDQNYNNFNLANNGSLNSIQGKINFTGGVNANSNNLSLRSLTGVNFANQNFSSTGGNLVITTFNPSGGVFVGSGNRNQFVVSNLDRANGFDSITIGENRNSGTITINENLTVNDPLTLQASNIFVNNTISGNDNASITLTGAKTTTTLNADIITQGNDIMIDDNVILGNNVTLSTGNGNTGNIDILGSINGNNNLTLNAGSSSISLTDNISLNSFSVTANNTVFEGNSVTTTGNQNFDSNLTLTKNTNFNSQGTFSAQNISSFNTNVIVSAESISTQNIVTKGGNISMISSEGAVSTQNLDTSGTTGGSIDINSNTTINTGTIQTSGNNQGGNVTLNAPSNIVITSIDTRGNNGGNLEITTLGTLRVTGTMGDGISINTTGSSSDGSVTIDLFPDDSANGVISDSRLPFIIGDASKNGTAGTINNLNFSIDTGEYVINTIRGNLNLKLLNRLPTNPNNAVDSPQNVSPLAVNLAPPIIPIATITEAREILTTIEKEAAEKPAFIYVSFTPKGYQPRDLEEEFARREAVNTQEYSQIDINKPNLQPTIALKPAPQDQLDLLIVTRKGQPFRVTVPVTREQVVESATNLWSSVSDIFTLNDDYKPYATELYSWLVAPLEDKLKEEEISNLLFILPPEIRFIPIAALYDGNTDQFLVEKYSSGLAPSLNLNDNRYRPIKDLNLLAMGAAQFADDQVTPLPAVGLELPTIKKIWNDEPTKDYQRYLNNNFTLEEIKRNIASQPFGIVHFGTHGEFNPTETTDSFIQLYNSRLGLGDLRNLGLNQPLVELMVLSACETAFGNEIAELGFAGLAVQAGVKTAMGSVWQVSDTGTLALMTDFYRQLKIQSTKAESLRQAQLNMLTGKVYKSDDGNKIITPQQEVSLETLPENSRQKEDFSHPFYWAPFTMIGNPW
jgi:filamentous hemagglutinin family protein